MFPVRCRLKTRVASPGFTKTRQDLNPGAPAALTPRCFMCSLCCMTSFRVRVVAGLLPLFALAGALPAQPSYRANGMIPEDFSRVPWLTIVRAVPALPGRPGADSILRVDLSGQMPPVRDQGAQGSCVAWAAAYYHVTHNQWVEHHWNVNDSQYQFSPAFVYNQINGGVDYGSSYSSALALICQQGVASMADCPYDPGNYTSWPSESAYSRAIRFRGDAGFWIDAGDTTGLKLIKQRLVNGYTSGLGIFDWTNFDSIQNFHNTYCSADRYGVNRGGHGVTIVGYDDTMTTHDGQGAFKLVNSFGPLWGTLGGYFWMSYTAVRDAQLSTRQAFYITNRVGYEPTMLGRVRVSHPARDEMGIRLGAGPTGHPVWSQDFRCFRHNRSNRPFPPGNMVFDLSGGEQFITAGLADTVFARFTGDTADNRTGTIDYFSVQHLPTGRLVVSPDPPETIPDAGVPAFARAVLGTASGANCLSYDNGVVGGGWAWETTGWGEGAVFTPPGYPCYLVGASFCFYPGNWPVPGGDEITVRVVADDGPNNSPGTTLYSSEVVHVTRGEWNLFALPESVIGAITSGRFYIFEIQTTAYPYCPGLAFDEDGMTRPSPWWVARGSTYVPADTPTLGDYMIRTFVSTPTGVAELLPGATTGPKPALTAPALVSGRASIHYVLPQEGSIELAVIDAAGRQTQLLVKGRQRSGTYRLDWNPDRLAPGVYFLRLEAGAGPVTRKVVRTR